MKPLLSGHLGYGGTKSPILLSEHLAPYYKALDSMIENCNLVMQTHTGDIIILRNLNLSFINWGYESDDFVELPSNYNCNLGYTFID